MMATVVYALCALTSIACAGLLLRAYARDKARLILFCALCFSGLALNNSLLFVDMLFGLELEVWRKLPAVVGLAFLIYGFVSEAR